jgi:hypothetical protein
MRQGCILACLLLSCLFFTFAFSTEEVKEQLYLHQPIYVYGDKDFTWENGVIKGNGTKDNPYINCNNLTDNEMNACDLGKNTWDNGYPSGVNYWDVYQGTDRFSGADHTQSDKDKIGDKPFEIRCGRNIDHYPLMEPAK